jgi:L-amino acid N-acyltransferase YncA
MIIRPLTPADLPAVRRIYTEGIATGNATFEQTPTGWDEWDAGKLTIPRLVAEADGAVVGWAAISPTSKRH